jgi:hypothetical protein
MNPNVLIIGRRAKRGSRIRIGAGRLSERRRYPGRTGTDDDQCDKSSELPPHATTIVRNIPMSMCRSRWQWKAQCAGVSAAEAQNVPVNPRGSVAALLQAAHDAKADLLVMGAYGHSSVRELVFGGFTRHVLKACDLPVLMLH